MVQRAEESPVYARVLGSMPSAAKSLSTELGLGPEYHQIWLSLKTKFYGQTINQQMGPQDQEFILHVPTSRTNHSPI